MDDKDPKPDLKLDPNLHPELKPLFAEMDEIINPILEPIDELDKIVEPILREQEKEQTERKIVIDLLNDIYVASLENVINGPGRSNHFERSWAVKELERRGFQYEDYIGRLDMPLGELTDILIESKQHKD